MTDPTPVEPIPIPTIVEENLPPENEQLPSTLEQLPKKKFSKKILLLPLLLILLILLFPLPTLANKQISFQNPLAFKLLGINLTPKENKPMANNKSTPTPIPTLEETQATESADIANWKTYTASVKAAISDLQKTGLTTAPEWSLKYPPDWILETDYDLKQLFFEENGEQYSATLDSDGFGLPPKENSIVIDEAISIGEYKVDKKTFKENDLISAISFTIMEDPFYVNLFFNVPPTNQEKYFKIFDQILSTFQFIN